MRKRKRKKWMLIGRMVKSRRMMIKIGMKMIKRGKRNLRMRRRKKRKIMIEREIQR